MRKGIFMRLHLLVGLGGVRKKERNAARIWDSFILYVMLFVVLALLTHWSYRSRAEFIENREIIFNTSIWTLFVIDVGVALLLVREKWFYLKKNWLKIVIIALAIPPLFAFNKVLVMYRFLDPVLAVLLLTTWSDYVWRSLSDNRLLTTLITFFAVIIVSGFLMSGIDPAITNPWQGFWCVLVTMSTVGYGDYVPTSFAGQFFASVLILMGLGFFAIVTANFAAIFLRKNVVEIAQESHEILHLLEGLSTLKVKDEQLTQILAGMEKRLTKLEKSLSK